jgi:hypothetical protein
VAQPIYGFVALRQKLNDHSGCAKSAALSVPSHGELRA